MIRTRRAIGISALVIVALLSTGVALEKAFSHSRAHDGAAVSEPAQTSDAVVTPVRGVPSEDPAATGSSEEYDRSDLLLSQG